MYLEDFREIIETIKLHKETRDNYLEKLRSVDGYLSDFIFENVYSNSIGMENDFLIKKIFGEQFSEEVFWFLYDWKPGYCIEANNVTYKIADIDSYIDYINNVYKLPMKPKSE